MPIDDPARDEEVLRELRYCEIAPGARMLRGQVGRAQDRAVALGWLGADKLHPHLLAVTERGRRVLAAAQPEQR